MRNLLMFALIGLLSACSGGSKVQQNNVTACAAQNKCSVTVAWDKVTTDSSGHALPETPHYRIYWGKTATDYAHSVDTGANIQGKVTGLSAGTYYFSVVAYYPVALTESPHSAVVSTDVVLTSGAQLAAVGKFTIPASK